MMNKYLLSLALTCIMFAASSQATIVENQQAIFMEQLASAKELDIENSCDEAELIDFYKSSIEIDSRNLSGENGLAARLFNVKSEAGVKGSAKAPRVKNLSKKTLKFETYAVMIVLYEGYTFHIADYYGSWGNSRVITALDGELMGLQEMADNGVVKAASNDVDWHHDYFVHTYPAGKVYSFENRQVCEFKK